MRDAIRFDTGDGIVEVGVSGGRVARCCVGDETRNLLYDDGNAMGGDRLWIAPEVAYFWPSLEDARRDPVGTSRVPVGLDPGTWAVDHQWEGGVCLAQSTTLTDARDGKSITLSMKRTVSVIAPPFGVSSGVGCVSFLVQNDLEATGGDDGAVAAAWDILQVPPGGALVCPVTRAVTPRSYYEPFGDEHVTVADGAVRFTVDAKRRIKMGLRPEHTTGRMGYHRPLADGQSALIVRVFPVYPGEQYVDVPRDHPAEQRTGGDALQAYNDDLTYGPFGETGVCGAGGGGGRLHLAQHGVRNARVCGG